MMCKDKVYYFIIMRIYTKIIICWNLFNLCFNDTAVRNYKLYLRFKHIILHSFYKYVFFCKRHWHGEWLSLVDKRI